MGPSGCGKTTLLNVLARRPATSGARVSGDTFVNGAKVEARAFGRMTSYVEQEDALIGSMTVRETLKFAADLSLPRYVSCGSWFLFSRFLLPSWLMVTCADVLCWRVVPCRNTSAWSAPASSSRHLVSRNRQTRWSGLRSARESVEARRGESAWQASSSPARRYSFLTSRPVDSIPLLASRSSHTSRN